MRNRLRTVAADIKLEQAALASLQSDWFESFLSLVPKVNWSSLITVRTAKYSIPAALISRQVRVSLCASELVAFDGVTVTVTVIVIARNPTVAPNGGQSVNLHFYLTVLQRKRGALPGCSVRGQDIASATYTAAHEAFWAAARKNGRDAAGYRQLCTGD